MGTLDANGVWQYDDNDHMIPMSAYMNLGQASISAALEDLRDDVEALLPDTGWVNLTLTSPWTAASGETPQIRRWGPIVLMRGRASRTSTTGNVSVATIPNLTGQGFWPAMAVEGTGYAGAGAFYRGTVSNTGVIAGNNFSGTEFRFSIFSPWMN